MDNSYEHIIFASLHHVLGIGAARCGLHELGL